LVVDVDQDATPVELPLACTLDAGDGATRVRRWRALAEKSPPRAQRNGHELAIWWRLDTHGANELETLAASERECCAFVTWSVTRQDSDTLLTITAEPGRPDDLDAIMALFAAN
jgi:hypothetical protein